MERAAIEAEHDDCASATADIDHALKLAPHRNEILYERERLQKAAPTISGPSDWGLAG